MVRIDQVSKRYRSGADENEVLRGLTLEIGRGEIVALLGPSGCGKSTLLNIVGGFERADEGKVLFEGRPVERPSRECMMIFQNYGLLPWRTVRKNVELGLKDAGSSAAERRRIAMEYVELVGLADSADRFPSELSGGMQQRVALARALAVKPKLILMDEPFGALDSFNRYQMQNELLRLQSSQGSTILIVTHDIDEALFLADRVLVMEACPGRIRQELVIRVAKPRDRGDSEFQHYRKRIFDLFHLSGKAETEFTI